MKNQDVCVALATRGGVGDEPVTVAESYSLFNRNTVVPQLIRAGFATLAEAEASAREYLKYHSTAHLVIVARTTKLSVCRTLTAF